MVRVIWDNIIKWIIRTDIMNDIEIKVNLKIMETKKGNFKIINMQIFQKNRGVFRVIWVIISQGTTITTKIITVKMIIIKDIIKTVRIIIVSKIEAIKKKVQKNKIITVKE
jgi:hypothetical protein